MQSFHAIRHRAGIAFICLIALLTAREGLDFGTRHLASTSPRAMNRTVAPPQPFVEPAAPFEVNQEPFRSDLLRPGCTSDGATDLPCREPSSIPLITWETDVVFGVDAENFPLSIQFAPEAVPQGDASVELTLLEQAFKGERWQPDTYGLWLPLLHKCSSVKKNEHGDDYCAPEDTPVVPEPATIFLLFSGVAVLIARWRN